MNIGMTGRAARCRTASWLLFCWPLPGWAGEAPVADDIADGQAGHQARIYRSPEERREAGIGYQLTDWLKIAGLFELEREETDEHFQQGGTVKDKPRPTQNLQLGLDLSIGESLEAEVVIETEKEERSRTLVDEALISWELGDWGITVGRHYVPFGEYYSHFIVGPMLEFGETRGTALEVDVDLGEQFELGAYLLESDVNTRKKSNHLDWGVAVEWLSEDESIRLGASYLSDLGESEEGLLHDDFDDVYRRRVGAWSAYALLGWQHWEVTAEIVRATGSFAEFDRNANRPWAYNFELAYFPWHKAQLSLRYEAARELAEAADKAYGIALTWLPWERVSLAVEYLRAEYHPGAAEDDEGHSLNDSDTVAVQLVIEF